MIAQIHVRVRYAETDQMGIVYHANYFQWFEMGRTHLLREAGLPYKDLELAGFRLPVLEAHCKYLKPAHYDDLLRIESTLHEVQRASLIINYTLFNAETETMLATGYTKHGVINQEGKLTRIPPILKTALDNARL
ncbi:MAG: acyl-CoA thioesterase [Gemmatimonadetes bacterium]|nr:MAG: acyl-CoA thioesterase [Gemmatimonadota bacterium]